MAKRKRLTPPESGFVGTPTAASAAGIAHEKTAFPLGVTRVQNASGPRAPIAQVAGDSAAAAALDEVTEALVTARTEGRLALPLPLDAVDESYLVRDRISADTPELDDLVASLRTRGQRSAIEVVDLGEAAAPRYGLISGWRRLTALRRLAAEDPRFATVAAIVRSPDNAPEAYLSMVEENEIRLGLSYYERARIVVKALEVGVFDTPRAALQILFANVSRAKRSKIKSVMSVVEALDTSLRFPEALTERAGLDLAKALEVDGAAATLNAALADRAPDSPEAETALLAATVATILSPRDASRPGSVTAHDGTGVPEAAHVYVRHGPDGLTLSGPGVDDGLEDALKAWLRRRGQFGE
ncbi:MAG: ParB N-terminal domain-containing protein [Pseudomonadota bacterium]